MTRYRIINDLMRHWICFYGDNPDLDKTINSYSNITCQYTYLNIYIYKEKSQHKTILTYFRGITILDLLPGINFTHCFNNLWGAATFQVLGFRELILTIPLSNLTPFFSCQCASSEVSHFANFCDVQMFQNGSPNRKNSSPYIFHLFTQVIWWLSRRIRLSTVRGALVAGKL